MKTIHLRQNLGQLAALACAVSAVWLQAAAAYSQNLSLAGNWRFQLDRADAGINERWFERKLPYKVKLPGTLAAQGIGDAPSLDTKWIGGIHEPKWFEKPEYAPYAKADNFKFPFWLQPDNYYAGAAWFQRDLEVPKDWYGKRVVLFLERPHWETQVWVDGKLIGTNLSLSTPHEYDLGQLEPGQHTVTIRVDNRMVIDVGDNSHCVSDHTQGNWNGIVGKIELRATPLVWIEELQVYPNVAKGAVLVKGCVVNVASTSGRGTVEISASPPSDPGSSRRESAQTLSGKVQSRLTSAATNPDGTFEIELPLGDDAQLWSEFSPKLYNLAVALVTDHATRNTQHVHFAFREVSTDGTQITINGRKTFIRGTLECAIFPKTGHPPTEVDEWKRIIRVAKAHGLNLFRFHSWCPPEAAFIAGDELGFYFQVETCWPNQSTTIGDGKPVDQWVYDETDRILKAYGNHPSFLLMAHGNEPGGKNANAYLAKYVAHYKALDPRRLWTSGSGWPELPENQFHVTPRPRIHAWGGGLKSRINASPPETTTDYRDFIGARNVPVISHEIGQWCVYPNFDEMKKYTGYLKAKNFEIFRDLLNEHGMGKLAKQFLLASGKLQTLGYKEDIESALRTPGMGGFELLDLHDFPGQGTALVGVLDPFWEEKGYVTPQEYSRFCNSTVPLARLAKRVFTTEEKLEADIEVGHFGPAPITNAAFDWRLLEDNGRTVLSGGSGVKPIPVGNGTWLGKASMDLISLPAPAKYKLTVDVGSVSFNSLAKSPGTFENNWDIWVYPAKPASEPAKDILVTAQFDEGAQVHVRNGGKLLLTIPGKVVRNFDTDPVKLGFSCVFWNTAWTGREAPTTLGILCDPKHPALAEFPTDFHSNWQWWYLIHRAGALRLDLLPRGLEPIVRLIDDWFTARPLGLVIEGKVDAGKIVLCGFDLTRDADDPVSKQMRASLLDYMASRKFAPKTELTTEQIRSLIVESKQTALRGVRSVKADSDREGYEAENAVDGNPATMWHTVWGDPTPGFPHELVAEFDAPKTLTGFTALPRQDGQRNGWIKDYAFYLSADGRTWGEPVAKGSFARDANLKTVKFARPATAMFIKLVTLSGHANGPWVSLAELAVLD